MATAEFNQLLVNNAEFLKPFAITLTRDSEAAKDLFQETLYRALANKDKYNVGTNIKAWLYTIMRNVFEERGDGLVDLVLRVDEVYFGADLFIPEVLAALVEVFGIVKLGLVAGELLTLNGIVEFEQQLALVDVIALFDI